MIDWLALVIGAIGIALAAFALIQSRAIRRSATAAAAAAEASADASEKSAAAAERSARAAKRAVERAAEAAHMDGERWHRHLGPDAPAKIDVEVESDPESADGHASFFGTVTVPRDYRVYGEAASGDDSWPLDLPVLLLANQACRFEIEKGAPGTPRAQEVRLLFWPPEDVDDVEHWSCPCDRETVYGDLESGHWEWRVPIALSKPTAARRPARKRAHT